MNNRMIAPRAKTKKPSGGKIEEIAPKKRPPSSN